MHTLQAWTKIRGEAEQLAKDEPFLSRIMDTDVLNHGNFGECLGSILSRKLNDDGISQSELKTLFETAYSVNPEITSFAAIDVISVYNRDPAVESLLSVIQYFKGYQAIQTHRIAHYLWKNGRKPLALYLQSRNAEVFGVDIHPACSIGKGVMFDHATGIVIGETAVIEDNVSILQSVTLGGTGSETGDRHPKIRTGVLIGAGATVLGNIEVGEGAKIGAGSVVLSPVPAHTTVVGVPAKVVGKPRCACPSETMDQNVLDDETPEKSESPVFEGVK
ncbi:serine O-acetyltransferase [Motiliproteus sp. MSK22-1]|uniref:serine O-acetyltransferase n=1 Tax=Motiliproteus sp. MSK22-1 TaxID=1897630 RepID=UPI0009773655|nr:serine O-acetyltransferase [Motiliproteus sp. MSK22-1]OMH33997.1 serine O-acetyltransferase [Motiliproteus sp. MSK22-1]